MVHHGSVKINLESEYESVRQPEKYHHIGHNVRGRQVTMHKIGGGWVLYQWILFFQRAMLERIFLW